MSDEEQVTQRIELEIAYKSALNDLRSIRAAAQDFGFSFDEQGNAQMKNK